MGRGLVNAIDIYVDERGTTSMAAMVATVLVVVLIALAAQVYLVNSVAADIQPIADAAALSAANTICKAIMTYQVMDAILLALNLVIAIIALIQIAVVIAAIAIAVATLGAGSWALALAAKIVKMLETAKQVVLKISKAWSKFMAAVLEFMNYAAPMLAAGSALAVIEANNTEMKTLGRADQYHGIAIPFPLPNSKGVDEGSSKEPDTPESGVGQMGDLMEKKSREMGPLEEQRKTLLDKWGYNPNCDTATDRRRLHDAEKERDDAEDWVDSYQDRIDYLEWKADDQGLSFSESQELVRLKSELLPKAKADLAKAQAKVDDLEKVVDCDERIEDINDQLEDMTPSEDETKNKYDDAIDDAKDTQEGGGASGFGDKLAAFLGLPGARPKWDPIPGTKGCLALVFERGNWRAPQWTRLGLLRGQTGIGRRYAVSGAIPAKFEEDVLPHLLDEAKGGWFGDVIAGAGGWALKLINGALNWYKDGIDAIKNVISLPIGGDVLAGLLDSILGAAGLAPPNLDTPKPVLLNTRYIWKVSETVQKTWDKVYIPTVDGSLDPRESINEAIREGEEIQDIYGQLGNVGMQGLVDLLIDELSAQAGAATKEALKDTLEGAVRDALSGLPLGLGDAIPVGSAVDPVMDTIPLDSGFESVGDELKKELGNLVGATSGQP